MKLSIAFVLCLSLAGSFHVPESPVHSSGDFNASSEKLDVGDSESARADDTTGRLFFWAWRMLFANGYTYTTTTTQLVTSTVTSGIISRCIPISLFKSPGNNLPCRRKRDVNDFDPDAEEANWSSFAEETSVTELPATWSQVRPLAEPELRASLDDSDIQRSNHRSKRNLYRYVVTVTSTTVSYSVMTTTWKTTAVMAASSTILCLPYGYAAGYLPNLNK